MRAFTIDREHWPAVSRWCDENSIAVTINLQPNPESPNDRQWIFSDADGKRFANELFRLKKKKKKGAV